MKIRAHLVALVAALAFPALAAAQPTAGWTHREDVAQNAHRLSERTADLYRTLASYQGYGHLADDARQLHLAVERLHRDVEAGAPQYAVVSEYSDLAERLDHVRRALFQAHDTHHAPAIGRSWARVVGSSELLAISLGVPGEAVCGGGAYHERPHHRPAVPVRPPHRYRYYPR